MTEQDPAEERKAKHDREEKEHEGCAPEQMGPGDEPAVPEVALSSRLQLRAIGVLYPLYAVQPPGPVAVDVFADLARPDYAPRFPTPASNSFSRSSSFSCRHAIVRSPRVRSNTPRTISVVRRRPPVSASGKSIVTRSE